MDYLATPQICTLAKLPYDIQTRAHFSIPRQFYGTGI